MHTSCPLFASRVNGIIAKEMDMNKFDNYQTRLATNLIAIILSAPDNEAVLAYAGNLAAALRDMFGREFIDWEDIADICDQREYALSQGRADDDRITPDRFGGIINRIQARYGMSATEALEDFLD